MKLLLPACSALLGQSKGKTSLRKLFLICCYCLFTTLSLKAQVTLANQSAVDGFSSTMIQITGDLNIGGAFSMSDITDLSPLSNIQKIDGDLNITFNDDLVSLSGLENIQSIGGKVFITNNSKLNNCTALLNLISSKFPVINDNLTGCNSAAEIISASQPPAAAVAVVPTFSQWGLFIFGLLLLNLGLIFVKQEARIL